MKFSELVRITREDLVVSPRHEAWLTQNADPEYSSAALAFMAEQLAKRPRLRRGTISASSLDACRRRQQFTYLGWTELPPTSKIAQIFHNGSFMHLRWQMAGLSAGWLAQAEVPVPKNKLRVSGTMDGLTDTGEVVELKSINTHGFAQVSSFGPKFGHKVQLGSYMYLAGISRGALIYEDKNTQEYREFMVELTDDLRDLVTESAADVWRQVDQQQLVPPRGDCEARIGYIYDSCPFRDRCLKVNTWQEATEWA